MKFSPALFWDIKESELDFEKNTRFIVSRVLMRGRWEDWIQLKAYYGITRLKQEVVKLRYLDKKTLYFCSVYFDIPKTQFRCYHTPQSIQQLWNY